DLFRSESVDAAHVVLPAAGFAERTGTTTNLEGRVTRVAAKVTAPGVARPDWMIAVELAAHLGADLGVSSVAELNDEIARVAPSHRGLDLTVLSTPANRDGVVVPLPSAGDETAGDEMAVQEPAGDETAVPVSPTDETEPGQADGAEGTDAVDAALAAP